MDALEVLEECGMRVVSIVYDRLPSNVAMRKLLSYKIREWQLSDFQSWLVHPKRQDEKILRILDAAHALKL